MAELKTKPTGKSVKAFLDGISDKSRRTDCYTVVDMMKRVTGAEPRMWGTGVVACGDCHYKYESGREGDWFLVGFASRKSALTLYITGGVERFPKLLEKLGKHKGAKGCIYIKKLDDVSGRLPRRKFHPDLADLPDYSDRSFRRYGSCWRAGISW